jgi:hypothetical protein
LINAAAEQGGDRQAEWLLRSELAAEPLPRDDQLHDLGRAVADLQPEHVA